MLGIMRVVFFMLVSASICVAQGAPSAAQPWLYRDGDVELAGEVFPGSGADAKLPVVVIFHDWMGISDVTREAAADVAKFGYRVVLADVYGKGVRPTDVPSANAESSKWKGDRAALRRRAGAAIAAVKTLSTVDASRVVAIGYCFGGTVALELARSGAPLAGVISVHGGLETPEQFKAKAFSGKVLALHGADDPFVPPAEVSAFETEMSGAGIDWQLLKFSGAVHAFTNRQADKLQIKGVAFNPRATARSLAAIEDFLQEAFAQ